MVQQVKSLTQNRSNSDSFLSYWLACTQTLFYFSFSSFRKLRRERSARKKYNVFFSHPSAVYFYHALSTDFEEKIEGLNRLIMAIFTLERDYWKSVKIDSPSDHSNKQNVLILCSAGLSPDLNNPYCSRLQDSSKIANREIETRKVENTYGGSIQLFRANTYQVWG